MKYENKYDAFKNMYKSNLPNETKFILTSLGAFALFQIGSLILNAVAIILKSWGL